MLDNSETSIVHTLHIAALVLHASQAIVLAALASTISLNIPVQVQYVPKLGQVTFGSLDLGKLHLPWFPVAFLALAATNHAMTLAFWEPNYREYVKRGNGWICWVEYSFSASLMNVAIAALSGMTDFNVLLACGGLTAVTMFFGWSVEEFVGKEMYVSAWREFWLGSVPFAVAWTIITFGYYLTSGSVPWFVHVVYGSMLALETAFAVNTAVFVWRSSTHASGRLRVARDYEISKVCLSFASKTLLAWLLFGGIRARKT